MRKMFGQETGSGLIELALVLPVLILLVLGVFDIGRGYVTYITLENSVREGARWLTTHPRDLDAVNTARARVLAEAGNIALTADEITITPSQASYQAGDEIMVAIDYPYALLFGAITGLPTARLHLETTMTVLY
ncbi:MAG: TadE/TadG family type IV pilus assembly protein [Caldilineaceae bacterium]